MVAQKVPGRRPRSWINRGNAVSAVAGLAVGLSAVFVGGPGGTPVETDSSRSSAANASVAATSPVRADEPVDGVGSEGLDRAELTARSLARTARFGVEPLSAEQLALAAREEQAFSVQRTMEAQIAGSAADGYEGLTARSRARAVRFDTTPLTKVEAQFVSEQEWWATEL